MKKIRYARFPYILIFLLIYMFVITFVSYHHKQTTYDILSNRLYYENAFIIPSSEQVDWNQLQFEDKSYGIYVEIDQNFRVEIADLSKRNPPMIWGEYPKNSTNNPKAVVGKNKYSNLVVMENNKKWITYLNRKFEVIGVVGTDYASSCDDLVILFDTAFHEYVEDKPIVIDSKVNNDLSAIADTILSKNPDIELMKRDTAGTARITKNSYYFNLLYIEAILLVSLAIILLSKLQWEKYRNRRKVHFILGIPGKRVILYQMIEMIVLNIISFVISIILGNLFNLFNILMLKPILQIGSIILFLSCISIQIFLLVEKLDITKAQIILYQYLNKKGNHKCS